MSLEHDHTHSLAWNWSQAHCLWFPVQEHIFMDMSMHTPGTPTYPMVSPHNTSHRPAPALLCTHLPTHTNTEPMGALSTTWPCSPTCPLFSQPLPPHITNRGPGAVTQQYGGGAVPGRERPEGPGEAYGQ